MTEQIFINTNNQQWLDLQQFSGTQILPLAEPIPHGSIHKLCMSTVIPVHYHPCDEYVYVLSGTLETGGHKCVQGVLWCTPANTKNGPHKAIT
ncbi:cupin [Gloeocapsopsis dulcis]|uniref:Cupin n=1 Tax=Gloeocapsopsis dulcis AAB1 = 1H9 TaxID=1433147 RepID=A0A6N8FWI8_9CHRO|nr:cupin [Gloeocapsopsis dulcis]MUL37229.1 cupin [Gloeocapsopsis dulcis AAB1 = 1H9]WNN90159.1 hypothetical protein P0S91_03400 [Gloeocapsopsis dulcis]